MLPEPASFAKYDRETRERICRWNDAFTVDESARQDRLVDAEIRQQDRGAWMTFALLLVFALASAASFVATGKAEAFLLLSVPALGIVGNLFQPLFSKSSRGKE